MRPIDKVKILASVKKDTIIGASITKNLESIAILFSMGIQDSHRLRETIANLKKSWDDSPETVQACFDKPLKPLFDETH